MFGSGFKTSKCETSCRLCVGRIKLIRNKKSIALKQSQKDIAELLRNGKQEYARIRVEGVIREKLLLQAFEILELYLELITVRTQLIAKTKELPRDMMEAVSSVIYAAQRISDLPELATLRAVFAAKYGKEYAAEAAADATASKWQVNTNLIRCLLVEAPQPEEKLAMLSEIAQEYGVEWDAHTAAREMGVGVGASGPQGAGLVPPAGLSLDIPPTPASSHYANTAPAAGPVPPGPPPAHAAMAAHPQYANAQQAAAAAAAAAAQAHAAAQYAAQVAMVPPPMGHPQAAAGVPHQSWLPQIPPVANGDGSPYNTANGIPHPAVAQPPPQLHPGNAFARSSPSPPPHDDGPPPPPHLPPPAGPTGPSGGASVGSAGGYIVRSNSDIQRDYDAALGPPEKGAIAPPAAPSAPPAAPAPPPLPIAPQAQQPPAPPPAHAEAKAPPTAPPPPPPQVEDEYEELTRRLEALKKS